MSNTLKSYTTKSVGTGGGAVYTVPTGTTATAIGCSIANNGSVTQTVSVTLTRAGVTYNWLPPGANIPVGSSLQCVGQEGKIVFMSQDVITVTPSVNTVDVIISVLEQA